MEATITLRTGDAIDLELLCSQAPIKNINFNIVAQENGLAITARSKEWNIYSSSSELSHKTIFVRLVKA